MFPKDWDQLVANHAGPKPAAGRHRPTDRVLGFSAVHLENNEMFQLFVDPVPACLPRGLTPPPVLGRGRVELAIDGERDTLSLGDGDSGRVLPPCRGSE